MRVLVTGGAGYIGCPTVERLLADGHEVRVFDSLRKGALGLLPLFASAHLEIVQGDVRDQRALREALRGMDAIIHLAAIVGYPACSKDPWLARETNVDGTLNLLAAREPEQLVVFPSSLSNYGTVVGQLCTEEMEPQPITIYGTTKLEAERAVLAAGNCVVYRPATAFGVSGQMRLDLLFNDFVYRATWDKSLVVYQPEFMRAFIHVRDFARACSYALDHAEEMNGQLYNLGDESLNLTKGDLAERIRERMEFDLRVVTEGEDPDQRNYTVDFSKLHRAGFATEVSIDEGIDELRRAMPVLRVPNPFANASY